MSEPRSANGWISYSRGLEPGSFRDPAARVFYSSGSVYRGLTPAASDEWERVAATAFFQQAVAHGRIVATEKADLSSLSGVALSDGWTAVLRHQTIPFVSYPYEWSFGMLKHAALLQLELLEAALADDTTLKDATPFNVQWIGARPIFIDVASFIRWTSGQPWIGYRQFCRMFLYPLYLQAYKGLPFHPWLRGRLDGISAEECRRMMSWRDMMRPGVLPHVVAQSRLERSYADTTRDIRRELQHAGFQKKLIVANVARLKKLVGGLTWSSRASAWSEYAHRNSYGRDESSEKERFVAAAIGSVKPRIVWDLGCNTGRFSRLAAASADYVVALDSDHESIERLYVELREGAVHNVLPLVVDLADPSPALGWRGRERKSLVERGRPDLVLCLALVHHLSITANIPLADLVEWFAELGAALVVEFPTPEDAMSRRLLQHRGMNYGEYSVDSFERCLASQFDVRDRLMLPGGTRVLYYAAPKLRAATLQFQSPNAG